ncbi:MAG: septum formation protein Maf [Cycloclasticus sp.]|nr:MAG: septum formation protein Maf [Cycloclasticus sp.]
MMKKKLVLASASPRRAELLKQIGVEFETRTVDIDEMPQVDELPENYVKRLALEKARAARLSDQQNEVLVLGSDTAVVIDGDILGKPLDKEHAQSMLRQLSGKTHQVLTSVALIGAYESCVISFSDVTFKILTDDEIKGYWATTEPFGKAGAYAIQGKAAKFIKRLNGSFSGVMGLPLYETSKLLKEHGFIIE